MNKFIDLIKGSFKRNHKKASSDINIQFDDQSDSWNTESRITFFNYEKLEVAYKRIYETILENLNSNASMIEVGSCDQSTADLIYRCVLADHPEVFWVSGSYVFHTNGEESKLEPHYIINRNKISYYRNKLECEVKKIISSVAIAEDTYEMILMLHDYIVDHSKYNMKAFKSHSEPFASTAYGCIVENNAICSGYSKGFQLLLNRIGVSCGYITGICNDGECHAWNYVLFEKDYYYVDITWDDPLQSKSGYDNKSHRYFFITDDDILKSREISEDEFLSLIANQ